MLTLLDHKADRNCQGFSRREFLRIGALGCGVGLGLPQLLAGRALAAAAGNVVRDQSVVFLFLQGGPSHIEMFDPKMSAPSEFRGIFGETPTKHPGITFGSTFPQLAALADKFSVVRSYASNNADHTYNAVMSAGNPMKAAISAIYARIAGANHPVSGIPNNILVLPEAVQDGIKMGSNFETGALPTLTSAGDLGSSFAAFNPSGGGQLKQNLELKVAPDRFGDRRELLSSLDQVQRAAERSGWMSSVDRFQQQAFEVITRGVADAFDLSREDPRTVARYDTSHCFRTEDIQQWYDMKRSTNLLGKQLLLARRLCEAGCGFVTVSDCGWDMHSNGNSPKGLGGMKWLGGQVDHAVAAFIEDCEQRGLRDKILLVVTGEMGRTPRINRDGGRDHYGGLTPLLLYGGGLKMGQVIGQSDAHATKPIGEGYNPSHLLATIMHAAFDLGQLRLSRGLPQPIVKLTESATPIEPLVA